jgi:endosialidase-like protein
MSEDKPNIEAALESVDEGKRSALRRLIGGGFATPIVASFAMSGLTVDEAAAVSNTTTSGPHATSDRRLKTGIVRVATHPDGFGLYRFRYLWSELECVGVLAQEVQGIAPHAVICGQDGFLRVDYDEIGVKMLPYDVWRGSLGPSQPVVAQ